MKYFIGMLFAIGLIVASSDGEWFPWFNLFGIALIGIVAIYGNKKGV